MKKQRTKGIWFVFSFELFSYVMGIFTQILIEIKYLKLPINEQVYLDSLGKMNYVFMLFSLVGFLGAVRLFLLKKDATIFYFFKFLTAVFAIFYNVFFTNWLQTHELVPSTFGTFVGISIQLMILVYVVRLKRAGILR